MGLAALPFGQTNIAAGRAAVNSQTGKFEAIRTTSMMVHGTYLLLNDGKTWVAGGYGTIYSSNPNTMPCTGKCGVLWWDGANAAEYLYARFQVRYPTVARFHVRNSGGTGGNRGPYHLMRTGPILRTAGYNGSSSGASSWLRMDPLFHCE